MINWEISPTLGVSLETGGGEGPLMSIDGIFGVGKNVGHPRMG